MKKKIAGKVGALLMAATMAFTGTTAAFAAEPADAHDDDVYEASVEQDQDEELSQASDRLIERGKGYALYKGTALDNGDYTVWAYVYNDELDGAVNPVISYIADKDIVKEESLIEVCDDNGKTYTVSKENLEKMKNKRLMFEAWYELEQGKKLSVSYQFPVVTNADSDFSNKLSINTDSTAASVLENAGIKNYETFTTSGESGSLLPGNGKFWILNDAETSKMYFSSDFDSDRELESGEDLFGYYYNTSTGRFIKYDTDKNNKQFSGFVRAYGNFIYETDENNQHILRKGEFKEFATYASFNDCDYNGTYVITQKEIPASLLMDTYTGLSHEGNDWVYYNNGKIDTAYTGLYKFNGSWWYVKDGKIDFSATTLCKYNGTWWYVSGGKVNFNATGLCKYNGTWWYVRNGKVDFNSTTLCKYNGSWWFVSGGKVNFNATGLCKYNGSWWYVRNGKVDFNSTTLCKYNGSWWFVSGGKVNFGATGLCKYNGAWWYINSGKVSFTTTLCKYNGTWWYIENGKINFNKTTLVKYGSNWYAVAGGKVAWNYSGNLNYNGGTYKVVNGVVKF